MRDYRSTPQVVSAANALTAGVGGDGVVLVGQREGGPEPVIRRYANEVDEEHGVAARVVALLRSGVPGSEIAVLHRFNSQAVRLQGVWRAAGVATTSGAGEPFFGRPEIKATLAHLDFQAAANPGASGLDALRSALAQGRVRPAPGPDRSGRGARPVGGSGDPAGPGRRP